MIYKHEVNLSGLVGFIDVELIPWRDRLKKTRDVMYKQVGEKLVERDDIERGELTISLTLEQVRNLEIKCGEKTITDKEELMMYREGVQVINEINSVVFNGVSLEKK